MLGLSGSHGDAPNANSNTSSSNTATAAAAAGPSHPTGGKAAVCEAAVAKAYSLYSGLDVHATRFGLEQQGMMRLVVDAHCMDDR